MLGDNQDSVMQIAPALFNVASCCSSSSFVAIDRMFVERMVGIS